MPEARRENLLARVEERLRARRKSDAASLALGVLLGSLAGIASTVSTGIIPYLIVAALYVGGFAATRRVASLLGAEYSYARSFISYTSSFILWWFSLYAALIQ